MENLLNELKKPFPVDAISWRIGQKSKDKTKAKILCYIDARDVMDRLDEVCGPNWQDDYKEVKGRIVCTITIGGISRSDGAGDTDFEGEKGGLSDAFKRAAVKWGIGRYLYNASEYNTWVDLLDDNGEEIPDYAVMDYKKNKERLYKVAEKISGKVVKNPVEELSNDIKKEVANQKRKETLEKKKEVEDFKQTKEYALQRYEAGKLFVKKIAQINPEKDIAVMNAIYQTEEVLKAHNLEQELEEFNKLVNSKIVEPNNDKIIY